MEQIPDETKPSPPTTYRGTFRRHRKVLALPLIVGALAAAFLVVHSTPSYTSAASIWVDTAPPLPSSVGSASTSLPSAPAPAEQGILSELLTTQAFAVSVAKNSLLGKYLGSAASIEANAPGLLEAGQIVPSVTGAQILRITYSGPSPAITKSVVGAIVTQLRDYNNGLTAQHGHAAVAYNQDQVKIAQGALATARSNVSTYLARHPEAASQEDPNYASLVAAENNADQQLGQANTALSQATGSGAESGWTMQLVDAPTAAATVDLGKKKMLEIILAGVLGGVFVSLLAVVVLTPAKKEAWEDELPTGRPFVPTITPPAPRPTAVGENGGGPFSGERRLNLRRSSESIKR